MGKGVTHHKHPLDKLFYLFKQQWGSGSTAALSAVVLELRWSLSMAGGCSHPSISQHRAGQALAEVCAASWLEMWHGHAEKAP